MGKATSIFYTILFLSGTSQGLELNNNVVKGTCIEIKKEFKNNISCIESQGDSECSVKLSCIAPELTKISGKTFSALGPNCFAAALYGAKLQNYFRGVSVFEFQETLSSSCVEVKNPEIGDIGIYYVDGFSPTHAYTFISENIVFEKPGVDYVGKTPVRFNSKASVDFIHIASKECRQWGDETCHSKQAYYRCSKINTRPQFKSILNKLNSIFDSLLSNETLSGRDVKELQPFYSKLYTKLSAKASTPLEEAIVRSVQLQIKFLEK